MKDVSADLILLHAPKNVLKERLYDRHPTLESRKEMERMAKVNFDRFVKDNVNFSVELREIFEKNGYPVIETNNKAPEEVAEMIVRLIT